MVDGHAGRQRVGGVETFHADEIGRRDGGRIVFPKSSAEHREQVRRLRADGVLVQNGRVARFATTRVDDL